MILFKESIHRHKSKLTYLFGLLILLSNIYPFFSSIYIFKYDYYTQHIPFYTEFYRLLGDGFPFWSWNGFLGLNFWASKTYYLIGDIYAWISVFIHYFINDIPKVLTILLVMKFIVAYSIFYLLTKFWNIKPLFRIILSLAYALSGWNLMFLEQVIFTSYYSLIPLLLLSLEYYFERNNKLLIILSVTLLVSVNFYFFWTSSILFLIYYIARYIQIYPFKWNDFVKRSFILIGLFVIGVLLSSIIWLPGVLHLIQSGRAGTFLNTFEDWSPIHIASFFAFSFIPNMRIEDGIFKDYYYYFNQISMYVGGFTLIIIPQTWFIKNNRKEKILSISLFILMIILLINPKIGIFFNFSYSLRYTIIHIFIFLFLASISLKNYREWTFKGIILAEISVFIIFAYLFLYAMPSIHPILPVNQIEINMLRISFILSIIYTISIILFIYIKKDYQKSIILVILFLISTCELYYFSHVSLDLSRNENIELNDMTDIDLQNAINYLKENDASFYRIYTNDFEEYYNLSYSLDFMSIKTHDTMYQYSLQDFLNYTRQYPYIHWGFNLHEYSILQQVAVKYEIIKDADILFPSGIYMAEKLITDQDFGPYTIYKYSYEVGFAKTYTNYKDISSFDEYDIEAEGYYVYKFMDQLQNTVFLDTNTVDISSLKDSNQETLYIQPTLFKNNYVTLDFKTNGSSILVLNMPYDKGWTITDNGIKMDTFSSQGGFMTLILPEGNHSIIMKFIPNGLMMGIYLTLTTLLVITIFYIWRHKSLLLNRASQNK